MTSPISQSHHPGWAVIQKHHLSGLENKLPLRKGGQSEARLNIHLFTYLDVEDIRVEGRNDALC